MTKAEALEQIKKELSTADHARSINNDGMVRVCARRAAGIAIDFWLGSNPRERWGGDAMSRLKSLQADETMPQDVREAALRLTARVTEQFTSPFPTDPLHDSTLIINHLLT